MNKRSLSIAMFSGVMIFLIGFSALNFSGILSPGQNVLGNVILDYTKCSNYHDLITYTQGLLDSNCTSYEKKFDRQCLRYQDQLSHYQNYYETWCKSPVCTNGEKRCMSSDDSKTRWVEECKNKKWEFASGCISKCTLGSCVADGIRLRLYAENENLSIGENTKIIIEITKENGIGISAITVSLGNDYGAIDNKELTTNANGIASAIFYPSKKGYSTISASSEIEGQIIKDVDVIKVN